jgi:hypothetical protein
MGESSANTLMPVEESAEIEIPAAFRTNILLKLNHAPPNRDYSTNLEYRSTPIRKRHETCIYRLHYWSISSKIKKDFKTRAMGVRHGTTTTLTICTRERNHE